MKVRATTSFSVDPADASITREDILTAVNDTLASFRADNDLVDELEASPHKNSADGDLLVDVVVIFRSDSYAVVDEAMMDLTRRVVSAVEAGLHHSHMAGRDTQLVPA